MGNLADVQVAANELEQARVALHEGLKAAWQTRATISLLYGIFVAARLWQQRGDAAC